MELGSATAGVVDPRSTRLWLVGGKVVGTDQGQTNPGETNATNPTSRFGLE
jgi:hypothetical protein